MPVIARIWDIFWIEKRVKISDDNRKLALEKIVIFSHAWLSTPDDGPFKCFGTKLGRRTGLILYDWISVGSVTFRANSTHLNCVFLCLREDRDLSRAKNDNFCDVLFTSVCWNANSRSKIAILPFFRTNVQFENKILYLGWENVVKRSCVALRWCFRTELVGCLLFSLSSFETF